MPELPQPAAHFGMSGRHGPRIRGVVSRKWTCRDPVSEDADVLPGVDVRWSDFHLPAQILGDRVRDPSNPFEPFAHPPHSPQESVSLERSGNSDTAQGDIA